MNSSDSRQRLLAIVPQLNHWQVFIALKFIEILQIFSPDWRMADVENIEPFDPLEKFIGSVDNGGLSQTIDRDLYG